jgi:hypothetical protein
MGCGPRSTIETSATHGCGEMALARTPDERATLLDPARAFSILRAMRTLTCVGAVLFVIAGASAGCSDDEAGSGGAGGSVETTTATTTSTSPTTSTTSSSSTTSTSTSASSTSTGTPACDEIEASIVEAQSLTSWSGDVTPELGGADPDYVILGIPNGSSGTVTLQLPTNIDDCADTQACVLVFEDFVDPTPPVRVYASSGGTITLDGTTSPGTASGTLTDVELVEVTLDGMTGALTPVADGACLNLPTASFEFDAK